MKQEHKLKRILLSGLLISSIIGLMVIYFAAVSHLPSQIYSEAQMEFLDYNYIKNIYQMGPTLNSINAEGIWEAIVLPWKTSHVQAFLKARYEEFEGVSATVYDLEFQGEYKLGSPGTSIMEVELFFPFPSNLETLHEVSFLVDGEEPLGVQYSTQGIRWQAQLFPKEEHSVSIQYHADGADTFSYALPQEQRSDVEIIITVSGLKGSTIPKTSLPPTEVEAKENGEVITWDYTNLIANRNIQITLPAQLGFAQRVTQLQDDFQTLAMVAPLLVGLSLLALSGVFRLSGLRLRLENYLLIGCGVALFYPLFTFLCGWIDVILAASFSLMISISLLLGFVWLTTRKKNILWRTGLVLIVFLGIFSLGMLTSWQGLLLTIGGLLLLGIFMILYARRPVEPEPEQQITVPDQKMESDRVSVETSLESDSTKAVVNEAPSSTLFYCPYCSREMQEDYQFCPSCGRDASQVHRCKNCGHEQFLPAGIEKIYCLSCGEPMS